MKKRILLVEDEPNIITSLTFILERAGFAVAAQTNGQAGLQEMLANPPDVVVLDAMLPALDGFEVLRRLREAPGGRALPVLMLTAKGQREDRENALKAGADRFISKPFANTDVVAAVTALAEPSQA